jgi:hypothetical protein
MQELRPRFFVLGPSRTQKNRDSHFLQLVAKTSKHHLPSCQLQATIRNKVKSKKQKAPVMSDMESAEDHCPASPAWPGNGALEALPAGGGAAGVADVVSFDRKELREIFDLYGRKVAGGEWRDYAIDFSAQKAVFSIYRRAAEYALYRIEKHPKLARKQGLYSVVTATGLILKRGHDLSRVIAALDKRLKLVSG